MKSDLMPVLFLGHGNPMNTLLDNKYTRAWDEMGRTLPRPKVILSISAHWFNSGTAVTAMPFPQTIHDFGGFPQELYEIEYPAPGAPDFAAQLRKVITSVDVVADMNWGLDHGTWSVLRHLYPDADVPVVQLSIDKTQPAIFHYRIGREISVLRNEGVLIVGSGNLVHNLYEYSWDQRAANPYEWALRFETEVRSLLKKGDDDTLVAYEKMGRDAQLSIPTPDHYFPFIYTLGARSKNDAISFPVEGFDGGSVSMLSVKFG